MSLLRFGCIRLLLNGGETFPFDEDAVINSLADRESSPAAAAVAATRSHKRCASLASAAKAKPVGPQDDWRFLLPMLAKLTHHPRYCSAGIRRAALRGCEIVSGNLLQARDRVAEGTDILFGQSRQCLDENEPADFAGQTGLEIREPGEGGLFLAAMHAFGARVETIITRHCGGKSMRAMTGGVAVRAPCPPSTMKPPCSNRPKPIPERARAATKAHRLHDLGQAFQTPQRGGDSKCQLGPEPKPAWAGIASCTVKL